MDLIRVDIETVVIGGGPVASLVVLKPRGDASGEPLPIRVGTAEASAIAMGVERPDTDRPMTHDLLKTMIEVLGAQVVSVAVTGVEGTTFFAQINLRDAQGEPMAVDARPSDAIALALRTKTPIFVASSVLATAGYPDFEAVKRSEDEASIAEFDRFIETLSPEDFTTGAGTGQG